MVPVKSIGFAARGRTEISRRTREKISGARRVRRAPATESDTQGAKWTRIYHSIASRLTSSEKFIMKINQLFCIQLIYGTWSRFRPRANFAICSICSAISLATFTIELFSSSHLSVSSCSSWAANYKTSNKTSTIRAPQEIIMISLRASK